jgi:hypothetical protein
VRSGLLSEPHWELRRTAKRLSDLNRPGFRSRRSQVRALSPRSPLQAKGRHSHRLLQARRACYERALHDLCTRGPDRGPERSGASWLSDAPQARQAGGHWFEPSIAHVARSMVEPLLRKPRQATAARRGANRGGRGTRELRVSDARCAVGPRAGASRSDPAAPGRRAPVGCAGARVPARSRRGMSR